MNDVHERWRAAMLANDLEEAWRQTDRVELPRRAGHPIPGAELLRWNGSPFDGQRVLIRCLHGLGDTLQYLRFIPALRARARSVILMAQPALLPLLAGCEALGDVRDGWTDEQPSHDVEIEIMELAYAFRTNATTMPRFTLTRENWPELPVSLRSEGKTWRAGLIWGASGWDPLRSIPVGELAPFGALENVRFFSLQQDREGERPPFAVEPLARHTRSVLDAAAAMRELDLVITADGMTAHLAGILARPVLLLLRHHADWRWGSGTATPWYPRARLIRQPSPGDWADVISQAGAILAAMGERVPAAFAGADA